ncbi:hypothetical protein [Pseudomonas sp. 25 E 4]|nr:hypothetical protein [Pseudomonas sp. 25 E 4]
MYWLVSLVNGWRWLCSIIERLIVFSDVGMYGNNAAFDELAGITNL